MASNRPALDIFEGERNGIARQNRWKVGKNEISLLNTNPDPSNKKVTFARVIVSQKVCDLIKNTRGQIWICGGTATVFWNDKLLDKDNEVHYNYQ